MNQNIGLPIKILSKNKFIYKIYFFLSANHLQQFITVFLISFSYLICQQHFFNRSLFMSSFSISIIYKEKFKIPSERTKQKNLLLIVEAHCQVSYPLMPKAKLGRNTAVSCWFCLFPICYSMEWQMEFCVSHLAPLPPSWFSNNFRNTFVQFAHGKHCSKPDCSQLLPAVWWPKGVESVFRCHKFQLPIRRRDPRPQLVGG